jgi:hypothetical protein
MSLERDLQSKIAVTQYETLHVQGKDTPVYSGTIDTMGLRDLTIAIVHQDVLAADDDVHIYFQDSPDGDFHICISRQFETPDKTAVMGGNFLCLFVPPRGS